MKRGLTCLVLFALLLPGCNSLHRVSGPEFVRVAEQVASMQGARYIGCTSHAEPERSRVYLEVWQMGTLSSSTEVYWTLLAELPEECAERVRMGLDPFAPSWRGSSDESIRLFDWPPEPESGD